ncbi:angiopoietin-related protein 6 isoform X1 [Vanacampus margaritifer]
MSTMEHTTLTGLILLSALSLELLQANGLRSIRETTEKHPPSSSDVKADRCSYTFIVPQQKLSGALCLDTKAAATAANQSEVAALRAELKRQQEQLRSLQTSLEQEGSFITEMRILRKESSGMNSRIAQLYSQLLQEVINKKDQALEQRRVENLLLNATTHALQVSGNFRELEKKYGALMSMMSSQSQLIARLEKQCQCKDESLSDLVPTEPPRSQSSTLLNDSSEISNDLQRDLSALQQDNPLGALLIPSTTASPSTAQPVISFPVTKTPGPWRDCQHVLESGETTSGIYLLRLQNANRLLQAWCEQNHAQGGWTVIQRRQDGSVNFFRTWEQYKQGFGNLDGEYWLGLEHLYWLAKQAKYKLRVVLDDWQGRQVFAEYDSFRLEPESDWYRLRLGQYRGNAGDSLSWHNNKAFTTLDRDKDGYTGNCAHYQKGGWWYHMCAHSNLNGVWYRGGHYRSRYQDGVYWAEFHGGSYSLKRVLMMVKPI